MPINPLITDKISSDNLPDKVKKVLNEILRLEEDMEIHDAVKDYKSNISKILDKYADDEEIRKFCVGYE